MKISFITTVYNEEDTLVSLLDSLLKQTLLPDEIIVVDAKSKDGTVPLLTKMAKKFGKIKFQVYSMKGNRSIGRNFAIAKSTGDIIVATDAGCVLNKNWIKNITARFADPSTDVAAGFYKPLTRNVFEKCLAAYTCTMEDKVTSDFLPSSRSIAFRKEVWEKTGGYPEHLDTCEDLVFARELKRNGFKFKVEKKAFVLWPQRKNIFQAFQQFFLYAQGDGQASYIRFNTWFLFARYITGLILFFVSKPILVICFLIYIAWSINKNYRYVKNINAFYLLPLLQMVSDIAVISGTITGILERA